MQNFIYILPISSFNLIKMSKLRNHQYTQGEQQEAPTEKETECATYKAP